MKTINTLSALLLIFASSASFATTMNDGGRERKLSVPVASYVYASNDAEVPAGLRYLKAKSALVPVAKFEFNDSAEAPAELNIKAAITSVPVAPLLMDQNLDVPLELALIKAKCALVPVAPTVWDNPETPADLK